VAIADFVWKYAPNGNSRETNFKLQGEYFWRRERGNLTYDADGALGLTQTGPYASSQGGGYLQGVWQFMPAWRIGARYDRLTPGTPDYGANETLLAVPAFHPQRATLMIDWTPSEFSRVRLQYAQNRVRPGVSDDEWFLQYILTLGAHGAHKF
jgi:outer membrane receptor protein involved in Fe transport